MTKTSKKKQLAGLFAWLLVVFIAASVGSRASIQAGDFYAQLELPAWAPPAGVFGPVWTVLYVLIAVSGWMAWREKGLGGARKTFILFFSQLILNALWTWLFFAWRMGALAFLEIVVLWLIIIITTVTFWRIKPLAGILLFPYLGWVTFAAALAFSAWRLNPALL